LLVFAGILFLTGFCWSIIGETAFIQFTHPLALFSLVVEDDEVEVDDDEVEGRATARTTIGARAEAPLLLRRRCSWAGRSCEPARRATEDCIVFVCSSFLGKERSETKEKKKQKGRKMTKVVSHVAASLSLS
jgi:hypothetical protein